LALTRLALTLNSLRRIPLHAIAAAVIVLAGALPAAAQAKKVNPDAAAIADFTKRVEAYAALRAKLDATLQEVPENGRPEQFIEHGMELGRLIQRARVGAGPGAIFTKPIRDTFRRFLAGVFQGAEGQQLRESILGEDTGGVQLRANSPYPETAPVSSMPPQILQVLPKLPPLLEYRFINKSLILFDAHGRLIVDYIERILR
jgi:hypothetical protein